MNPKAFLSLAFIVLLLAACSAAPEIQPSFDPAELKFDGEKAFALETELVTRFPERASGYPNNRLAAEWIQERMTASGWDCSLDQWEVINYSQPTPLNNVVCKLPGDSEREILLIAHHDQAMTTVQGADNDAAGIAILMHLGEIFAQEKPLPYSLVFVATDAEEYGGLGSLRYMQTHADPENIIAGFSMDNVGRSYYDGVKMEQIGQYRKFGALWLALALKEAAGHAGLWPVALPGVVDQMTGQMAPVSFMDQGSLVAAGVPALGIAGREPPEYAAEHYSRWHTPEDNLESQSASTVGNIGLVAEALIRQLQSMQSFPQESGPYLYLESSNQVLRGWPLWLIFTGFTALFFLGSFLTARAPLAEKARSWKAVLPHFFSFWLPLAGFVILLYLFVETGLLLEFNRYPATTKDPYLTQPDWAVFGLALVGLAVLLLVGRLIARRFAGTDKTPGFGTIKSFALFIIGLAAVYVLALNPFSLLFLAPLLFWFLIGGRKGFGKVLDVVFFLLGGLMLYALIYMFGFLTLRYDFAFLWMLMNMIAIRMVSFPTMAVIAAIFAAGFTMVVNPPHKATGRAAQAVAPAGV
jgi:hypothetical protein